LKKFAAYSIAVQFATPLIIPPYLVKPETFAQQFTQCQEDGEREKWQALCICNFNKWRRVAEIYLTFKLPNVFGFWHLTLYLCASASFMASSHTHFTLFPCKIKKPVLAWLGN